MPTPPGTANRVSTSIRAVRAAGVLTLFALLVAAAANRPLMAQSPASDATAPGQHVVPAAPDTGRATLSGVVTRADGTPIPHVAVSLVGANDSASTDDDGHFTLRQTAPGAYMVSALRLGFRPERFAVTLAAGDRRGISITMAAFVPMLPTVTTTAEERAGYRSVGLDQRMQLGVGQFLTYDQIVQRQASSFSQLLEMLRGIRVWQENHSFGMTVEGTRGVGSCVAYVVNGMPEMQLMDRTAGGLQSIGPESPDHFLEPDNIGAIEVYTPSERPVGYGTRFEHPPPSPGDPPPKVDLNGQQCSLVMIWTRDRLGLLATASAHVSRRHASDITLGRPVFAESQCKRPPASDTADLLVYATLEGSPPRTMPDSTWSRYKQRVLAALDESAALPSALDLPGFGVPLTGGSAADAVKAEGHAKSDVTPTFSNVIALTLDATGHMTAVHIAATSLSPGADTSILAMAQRAEAAHAFPALPSAAANDSAHLILRIAAGEPTPRSHAAVLGQLEAPVWELTRPAQLATGAQPGNVTQAAGDSGHGDGITAELIVDADGHAIPAASWIMNGTSATPGGPSSAAAAHFLDLLPQLRFEPARIGTCHVSQRITRTFVVPQ